MCSHWNYQCGSKRHSLQICLNDLPVQVCCRGHRTTTVTGYTPLSLCFVKCHITNLKSLPGGRVDLWWTRVVLYRRLAVIIGYEVIMTWHNTTQDDTTRHDTTRHVMTWHGMAWYDIIWYDLWYNHISYHTISYNIIYHIIFPGSCLHSQLGYFAGVCQALWLLVLAVLGDED